MDIEYSPSLLKEIDKNVFEKMLQNQNVLQNAPNKLFPILAHDYQMVTLNIYDPKISPVLNELYIPVPIDHEQTTVKELLNHFPKKQHVQIVGTTNYEVIKPLKEINKCTIGNKQDNVIVLSANKAELTKVFREKPNTLYVESSLITIIDHQVPYQSIKFVKGTINNNIVGGGFFIFSDPSTHAINISNFLATVASKIVEYLAHHVKKYEYIRTFFEGKQVEKYHLQKFVNHQVQEAKWWCKANNIKINPIYEKPVNRSIVKHMFPEEQGVSFDKICITNDSIYSVTKPKEAEKISQIIKKHFPDAKSIVDTSANIGGNTINFAKHFDEVTAIEINPDTFKCLKQNLRVYKRKNVLPILGDYVDLKDRLTADIFFFDPPWSGIFYKMETQLDMYLSGVNILDLMPENFVLKAPYNYNVVALKKKWPNTKVLKIANYLLAINKSTN